MTLKRKTTATILLALLALAPMAIAGESGSETWSVLEWLEDQIEAFLQVFEESEGLNEEEYPGQSELGPAPDPLG